MAPPFSGLFVGGSCPEVRTGERRSIVVVGGWWLAVGGLRCPGEHQERGCVSVVGWFLTLWRANFRSQQGPENLGEYPLFREARPPRVLLLGNPEEHPLKEDLLLSKILSNC